MHNLNIYNGRVLDFNTKEEKVCDIHIKDGIIQSIGSCRQKADIEIDAAGKIVAPGFIDIHMHEEIIGASPDGDDYDIANKMLLMGATTCVGGNCGNNRQSIEDFFNFIDKNGSPVNYLSAIGHNYMRNIVGNTNRYTKSSSQQIASMIDLANSAIEHGAIGLSFGLEYSPGTDFEEVITICKGLERKNILLSAHYRKDAKYGIDSIKELIEISKLTEIPMQISHLGSCTAYGMMKESLDIIQHAINQGIDIMADCYPYDAFSTFIGSAVFDEGCFELWNKSYDSILLTEKPFTGTRCDKELFHKVRKEYPDMLVVAFVMNQSEIIEAVKAPFVMVASDGLLRNGKGHPRAAGTFPKVLGKFARDMKEISFLDALSKMTVVPARRLGLKNKGEIKEGFDADLVIFDKDLIIDMATFENPTLPPKGISYVILDGKIAVKDNIIIDSRLGKVIRKMKI